MIQEKVESGTLTPAGASTPEEFLSLCSNNQLVIAAGAAGVCFLPEDSISTLSNLKVAIDLNAVPPVGIADIGPNDKTKEVAETICYGALGVGGTKMKVHKRAVAGLFETNDAVFDTTELYNLALEVAGLTK